MKIIEFLIVAVLGLICCVQAALLAVDYGQEYTKAILIAPSVPVDLLLSPDSKRKDVSGLSLTTVPGEGSGILRNYGFHALNTCIREPAGCLTYLKPLIGKSPSDPAAAVFADDHPGVEMIEIEGRNSTGFRFGSSTFSVEEIVAMNLADIKERAQNRWDELSPNTYNVIDEVAISVPRYYSQTERKALVDAAEISGMRVAAFVDDGVSAAISYAEHRTFPEGQKQYNIIYDMGAGSTKATLVSVATINDTLTLTVEGYGYDRVLGGQVFTSAIKNILIDKFMDQHKNHISRDEFTSDSRAMNKLWQAADKAKLVLSANTETRVSLDNLYAERDLRCVVSREEFEQKVNELIENSSIPLKTALGDLPLAELNSVILVGGSTRVPAVQKRLAAYLGSPDKLSKNVNADEAVVYGLTLRSAGMAGYKRRRNIDVIDRAENELAVAINGLTEREVIIEKGAAIEKFTIPHNFTLLHGQTGSLNLTFFEGAVPFREYHLELSLTEDTCPEGLYYTSDVVIKRSGVVHLKSMKAVCIKDAKTTTTLPTTPEAVGIKPLNPKQMKDSKQKLAALNVQDKDRIYRESLINSLEASLYDMRDYLEDEEVIKKGPQDLIIKAGKLVSELLIWLDDEAPTSSTKEIKKRLGKLQRYRSKLHTYVATPDELLTLDNFVQLTNDSTTLMHELQDFMVTMSEDAMEMQETYEKNNLNFEEASGKLNFEMKGETEAELLDAVKHTNKLAEIVKELEAGSEGVKGKSRRELIDLRESSLSTIKRLKKCMKTLQMVHDTRLNFLKERLRTALNTRARKAKKNSIDKAETETKTEITDKVPQQDNSTASTSHNSSSSGNVEHDEL
ncbi:hypothetical protein FOA43_000887 [Brettanomyces nanus]|uniref:Uncharacterized protein n=1 Tax=Eeniella nana TaxID=13502 RepID=A0A875RZU8_EENNA|nr:uncharacterized protein FOA43_000887 [Brettanomyces nanus]QPG73575.1 hypothetical protein FOA43_000887 [Brettanomyces nanus]